MRAAAAVDLGLLALAIVAAGLMVAAEFSTLFAVDVGSGPSCEDLAGPALADTCATTGREQHSYALVLLALLATGMAAGATLARSPAAAFALLAVGLVVLGIALVGDLPDATREGAIGERYTQAEARRGAGLAYELAGGLFATLAGALLAMRTRRRG